MSIVQAIEDHSENPETVAKIQPTVTVSMAQTAVEHSENPRPRENRTDERN